MWNELEEVCGSEPPEASQRGGNGCEGEINSGEEGGDATKCAGKQTAEGMVNLFFGFSGIGYLLNGIDQWIGAVKSCAESTVGATDEVCGMPQEWTCGECG